MGEKQDDLRAETKVEGEEKKILPTMRSESRCGGTYFCYPNQTIEQTHVERRTEEKDGRRRKMKRK